MSKPTIDEILAPKSVARPRIPSCCAGVIQVGGKQPSIEIEADS